MSDVFNPLAYETFECVRNCFFFSFDKIKIINNNPQYGGDVGRQYLSKRVHLDITLHSILYDEQAMTNLICLSGLGTIIKSWHTHTKNDHKMWISVLWSSWIGEYFVVTDKSLLIDSKMVMICSMTEFNRKFDSPIYDDRMG